MIFKQMPKELANLKEADWVREMREYHGEHGKYRAEDLDKLLGSPTDSVSLSSDWVEAVTTQFGQIEKIK